MIIYGSTMSPFVRKVVAFAREKGAEFELKPVGFQDPDPGFRAASPLGKMPAIHDDGFDLADSSAICHYLEVKHGGAKLIPDEPQARGLTIWWDKYSDTVQVPCGGKMFFNRIVAPIFLKRDGDTAVADRAEAEELPPILDFLETRVPDAGNFLVGESLTLADLSVASPFANLNHVGVKLDAKKHGRLKEWIQSILERPCFAESIAREKAFLAKVGAR